MCDFMEKRAQHAQAEVELTNLAVGHGLAVVDVGVQGDRRAVGIVSAQHRPRVDIGQAGDSQAPGVWILVAARGIVGFGLIFRPKT